MDPTLAPQSREDGNDSVNGEQHLSTALDAINLHLNPVAADAGGDNDEVHLDMEGMFDGGEEAPEHSHGEQRQPQGNPALAILMPYISKFGVFVLLILLKILYSHRYGLLIIIGTVGTWHYADSTLTKHISLRSHTRYRLFAKPMWVIVVLLCSLFGIYYFLDDNHSLAHRLILSPFGLQGGLEVWALLWHLIITDYAVKFLTIIFKSLLTLAPKSCISSQLKGKLYMLIERLTEFYRSLLPTVPWYFFLVGTSDGPWFSAVLFVAYFIFKFLHLYSQLTPLKTCILRIISSEETYGRMPSTQELSVAESTCAVCHDEYTEPMILRCKHIFCEECVMVWFDKEASCPMCRAKIVTGDNAFRDGSSSWTVQFF